MASISNHPKNALLLQHLSSGLHRSDVFQDAIKSGDNIPLDRLESGRCIVRSILLSPDYNSGELARTIKLIRDIPGHSLDPFRQRGAMLSLHPGYPILRAIAQSAFGLRDMWDLHLTPDEKRQMPFDPFCPS